LFSIDSLAPIIVTVFAEIASVFTPLRPPDSNGVVGALLHLVTALFHPICPVFPAILPPLHTPGLAEPEDRHSDGPGHNQDLRQKPPARGVLWDCHVRSFSWGKFHSIRSESP
jgi:hypothetical protein